MTVMADGRYIVTSADGHPGAQMHEYRDSLEPPADSRSIAFSGEAVKPW
jgi:hypothetical protein